MTTTEAKYILKRIALAYQHDKITAAEFNSHYNQWWDIYLAELQRETREGGERLV